MVHQIRIDDVLQIPPPVVGQQDIYGFRAGVGAVGGDAMVDRADDVGMRGEECVRFYFFHGLRDGFLAEGAADLFQGVEGFVCGVLDEVDVGETALDGSAGLMAT